MNGKLFDGILIDFYGTICAGDREAVELACARIVTTFGLPLSAREFANRWGERFFTVLEQSNHDAFQTLYQCEMTSLGAMFQDHGISADPAPFVADLESYWRDPPLHEEVIAFLEGLDLPICCVSNADAAALRAAIEKHRLRFDAVVCSESARCYKPQAAIFLQAMEAIGVSPERAIHIGDSLHSDVGGASPLGIKTAWVCRPDRIHDIGRGTADYSVSRLDELADVLSTTPMASR
jgi:2-haloalkanoic acid dehalogenase type II